MAAAVGGGAPGVPAPAVEGAGAGAPADGVAGGGGTVGGAAPAVGGAAARGADILPQWNAEWCMEEIKHFRTNKSWGDLLGWVGQNLATVARQALSAHMTIACQAKKQTGPSGSSLKGSGMDTLIVDPAISGRAHVEFQRPDTFVHGDGLAIKYTSPKVER